MFSCCLTTDRPPGMGGFLIGKKKTANNFQKVCNNKKECYIRIVKQVKQH